MVEHDDFLPVSQAEFLSVVTDISFQWPQYF